MLRFGPAGWSYADWKGIVYPKPAPSAFDPLRYLAGYFDTIEINSTFYRPPTVDTANRWVDRVRDNPRFRFALKLWRRFTHEREEAWTRQELDQVRAPVERIVEAGLFGTLLVQFPWSFRATEQNREWLAEVLGAFPDLPVAVEVRHQSWNSPDYFAELERRDIAFVNIDQPQYRDSIAPSARVTAPVAYVRVHGRNYRDWWRKDASPHARYDYLYPADELKPWAKRAREIAANPDVEDTYVITNNHYRGKAVVNALMLASIVQKRRVGGPPDLFEVYGDVLAPFADPVAGPPRSPPGS